MWLEGFGYAVETATAGHQPGALNDRGVFEQGLRVIVEIYRLERILHELEQGIRQRGASWLDVAPIRPGIGEPGGADGLDGQVAMPECDEDVQMRMKAKLAVGDFKGAKGAVAGFPHKFSVPELLPRGKGKV